MARRYAPELSTAQSTALAAAADDLRQQALRVYTAADRFSASCIILRNSDRATVNLAAEVCHLYATFLEAMAS